MVATTPHSVPVRAGLFATFVALVLLAALGLLAGCSAGKAGDTAKPGIVMELGWWIDHDGRAELADAQQVKDWTAFSGLKTFGFEPGPIWFKLRLSAASRDSPPLWTLRVLPAYLDELTFHDPGVGRVLRAGRAIQPTGDLASSINYTFPVPSMSEPRDVYVRLESVGTRLALIDVVPYEEAAYRNRLQEWAFAALIALSAVSALWAVAEWALSREGIVGAFAIKQLCATVWAFVAAGFARVLVGPWLPSGHLTIVHSTMLALLISACIVFLAMLMWAYRPSRHWIRMLFGLALMFALMPLMQLAGFAREMRMIVNVCIPLLFVLLLLTLTSVARKKSDQPVPVFLLFAYLGVYSLLISVPAMINLGGLEALAKPASPRQIDGSEPVSTVISVWEIIAVYASLASLMLDGLLMRVLLIHRARALQRAQHKTEFELLRSKEESLARARLSEEQSKLFSMLAHEMKTPLATLRMWIDAGPAARAAMERAISDMNQVIERCVHTGQLAEQGLQPMPQADDAAGLTTAGIQACRAPERVRLSGPEGPAPILADTQMLSIALNNLLDNALKYSPAHTRIEVTLREEARDAQAGWTWQVRNHPGQAGMPDAGRVFDKYYRSLGARHQSGSGLGLFLVQGLLELMGGTVRFEARDGQAVFTMWVPAAPPPR